MEGDWMERYAMQELLLWKQKENRKPMLLKGARQVGKTWGNVADEGVWETAFQKNSIYYIL